MAVIGQEGDWGRRFVLDRPMLNYGENYGDSVLNTKPHPAFRISSSTTRRSAALIEVW